MATAIKWGPSVERLNLLEKKETVKTNRARIVVSSGVNWNRIAFEAPVIPAKDI